MSEVKNDPLQPVRVNLEKVHVLLVDQSSDDAERLCQILGEIKQPRYEIEVIGSLQAALKILEIRQFDVILLDSSLPDSSGLETFLCLYKNNPSVPFILMARTFDEEFAMDALRRGAQDVLPKKDLNIRILNRVILYAIERKKTENEMYLAQEKYRTIFENSAAAITVTDSEERIISWNKFAEKLLKMGAEDLYLKPVSSLYTEDEWKRIRSLKIRDKGIQHNLETFVRRKDGVIVDTEISITVLKDAHGNITGSIGIMKDISERKRAARELRLAEEKYRTIFDNSAAAIMVADQDEKIISWNKFTEEFLGMQYEDLYLRSVESLYPTEEWKKIRACNIREKGTQHILETRTFHKSGRLIDVDISITVLKDANGKITGSIGILKDITARKKLLELKDDFVNHVSHELRTPLSIVKESISQVNDGLLGETTEKQRNILKMSLRGIERLIRIINDLLEVSKMEAKKMNITKSHFKIKPLVLELTDQFKHRVKDSPVQIEMTCDDDDLTVFADRDRLIQIFTNLINNAFKFTDEGKIEIIVTDTPEGVRCAVTDTGRGISEEDQQRLFSKFEQFGQAGKGMDKGSGLGLSICKGLVELHGGRIDVESTLNQGTSFHFLIPHHT